MKLGYQLTHPKSVAPKRAHDTDACFDVTIVKQLDAGPDWRLYDTGVKFDISKGYHLKAFVRSSIGFKSNLVLANGTGIIDAGYIDTVKVKLVHNGAGQPWWPYIGDRVIQVMLEKNTKTELVEVNEIKETERGEGGIGSTGK